MTGKDCSRHGEIIARFFQTCRFIKRVVGVLGKGVTNATVTVVLSSFANVLCYLLIIVLVCPFYNDLLLLFYTVSSL